MKPGNDARINMRDAKTNERPGPDGRDSIPLVVDLDGTLIRTDLLLEGILRTLVHGPGKLLGIIRALFKGKAAFKAKVARSADMDFAHLPFVEEFHEFLKKEKANNRSIYLASAGDRACVERFAQHVNLFDGVFASDGKTNLSGKRKAKALCEAFGEKGFDYAGNARCDLDVWAKARRKIAVNCSLSLAKEVKRRYSDVIHLAPAGLDLRQYFRAVRVYQWPKNSLLFLPMLTAHVWNLANLKQLVLAFFSFSLFASSVYVANDLVDLSSDRQHVTKKKRPFASGEISISHGLALIPLLMLTGIVLGLFVSWPFVGILAAYFVLTSAYSLYLKRKVLVDVFMLSGLYLIRVIAGAAVVQVPISSWFIAFTMFLFLSLALIKRQGELKKYLDQGISLPSGRGYRLEDLPLIQTLGAMAGYSSVIVLSLYLNSDTVAVLYNRPKWLWLICILLLYWISRMLLIASRGNMPDDPVVFTLKDRISLMILVLTVTTVAWCSL